MRNRIISLVSNNIATDQRLIKVGKTLTQSGYEFLLIGLKHRGEPSLDHVQFLTKRLPVLFKKNIFFYVEIQIRFLIQLLKESKSNTIILANDLDTLLPAFLVAKTFKIPLIFDSHEIFSELPSLKEGSIQKRVWQYLERRLLPKTDAMYTVSNSYATFFKDSYGIDAKVVSNFPVSNLVHPDKNKTTQILNENKILIYQGAINESRGIDKMILAMPYLENTVLWIVGDGPMKPIYEQLVKSENLEDKIKFWGRINPETLKNITAQANLGLSLEEDNGLSYRYALPNKVFDYIYAGIPILGSSDLPEVEDIILKYKVGDVIHNHNPTHIADKIKQILARPKNEFKAGIEKAQSDFKWENHEPILLSLFSEYK
ncbi:MAG: glycosyltransferase [Weeksellaceae bacterium]